VYHCRPLIEVKIEEIGIGMIKRDKDEKETCCDVKKGGLEATTPKLSFVKL